VYPQLKMAFALAFAASSAAKPVMEVAIVMAALAA
jgi:hypothetical protein